MQQVLVHLIVLLMKLYVEFEFITFMTNFQTEICEPEFTKLKNPEEKKAMFQMLDDFEDISVQFTNVAMSMFI